MNKSEDNQATACSATLNARMNHLTKSSSNWCGQFVEGAKRLLSIFLTMSQWDVVIMLHDAVWWRFVGNVLLGFRWMPNSSCKWTNLKKIRRLLAVQLSMQEWIIWPKAAATGVINSTKIDKCKSFVDLKWRTTNWIFCCTTQPNWRGNCVAKSDSNKQSQENASPNTKLLSGNSEFGSKNNGRNSRWKTQWEAHAHSAKVKWLTCVQKEGNLKLELHVGLHANRN